MLILSRYLRQIRIMIFHRCCEILFKLGGCIILQLMSRIVYITGRFFFAFSHLVPTHMIESNFRYQLGWVRRASYKLLSYKSAIIQYMSLRKISLRFWNREIGNSNYRINYYINTFDDKPLLIPSWSGIPRRRCPFKMSIKTFHCKAVDIGQCARQFLIKHSILCHSWFLSKSAGTLEEQGMGCGYDQRRPHHSWSLVDEDEYYCGRTTSLSPVMLSVHSEFKNLHDQINRCA